MSPDTSAPRLLALPGLGLDAASWQPCVELLDASLEGARSPEVVLLPGLGLPAGRRTTLDPRTLAVQMLSRYDDGVPFVLLGHSAGAQVAAHVARLAPGRVRALVLVGPSTDPRRRSWAGLSARLLASLPRERPTLLPSQLRQYAQTGTPSMRRLMSAARRDRIDITLSGVSCPVLVVRGPGDRICPEPWVRHLAQEAAAAPRSPLARCHTLPGGAHMAPRTHASDLSAVILDFLADVRTLEAPGGPVAALGLLRAGPGADA